MKYNKIFSALAGLLLMAAGVSCTDEWNDHYANGNAGSGQSMWSVLESDKELSNFVKVLKATGYDNDLSSSQVFTVFAPTNDQLTDAMTQTYIDKYNNELKLYNSDPLKRAKTATVKEFVQNHIALYNYSASQAMPDTVIRMLNGKYVPFTKNSFGGHNFKQANITTGNGVIFTMNDIAKFEPNIFEYIKMDEQLDSVAKFIYMNNPYQFHVDKFIAEESVPGEIINGQQHFLDSVTEVQNELLGRKWLNAQLNNEDSTYYVLLPTNEVWKAELEKISNYFVYDKTVPNRDSLMYVYPRYSIIAGTQFSISDNKKLGVTENMDSIMSTLAVPYNSRKRTYGSYNERIYQYQKPYAANGIFYGTEKVERSNGVILKASDWKVDPRNTYLRKVIMEAESNNTLDSLSGNTAQSKPSWTSNSVTTDNPYYNMVSNNTFQSLRPSTATAANVLLDFTNVLSNVEYDMYVITVPARAGDTLSVDTLPSRFEATVYYHNEAGKEVAVEVNDKVPGTELIQDVYANLPADMKSLVEEKQYAGTKKYSALVNPNKVQKIKIGRFTFPTCSWKLDQPQVKVRLTANVYNRYVKLYSTSLHLDQIILEPVVK